jgi:ubiquinone/menaquinone biosynthesis C-methylase UbiE
METPRAQSEKISPYWKESLNLTFKECVKVSPEILESKIVVDLGCGKGYWEELLLKKLPKLETVHAIDYHDMLDNKLKTNPKIYFYKGMLPESLKLLPEDIKTDFLVMANLESEVFQTDNQVELLNKVLGKGTMLMFGDNAEMDRSTLFHLYFDKTYQPKWTNFLSLWKTNNK